MAAQRVELLINTSNGWEALDLSEDNISIAIQIAIDDIKNIESRNSSYTKDIDIPATKVNNLLLGHLFDVNSDFTTFNPNFKIESRITVNGTDVMSGYLQLNGVFKDNRADLQSNKATYSVTVFDETIDFIKNLGDKELTDLDFSDYDHILSGETIVNAWTANTFEDVYQYPLLDKAPRVNSSNTYEAQDFKVAVYHKAYLLQMAEEAGFTLSGSFMDNEDYAKEIIPYNGEVPKLTDEEVNDRLYSATMSADTAFGTQTINGLSTYNQDVALTFDDVVFDNSGLYTPVSLTTPIGASTWEVLTKANYAFAGKIRAEFEMTGEGFIEQTSELFLKISLMKIPAGSSIAIEINKTRQSMGFTPTLGISPTVKTLSVSKSFNFKVSQSNMLNTGDIVYLKAIITSENNQFAWNDPNDLSAFSSVDIESTIIAASGFWKNEVVRSNSLFEGDPIVISEYVPNKFKQKDIITDLVKRYNLYIQVDKDNPTNLILQTRDNFYASGSTLDWTQKKDYSRDDKIQFLTELQNKETLFTYTPDPSAVDGGGKKLNEQYTKLTDEVFGEFTATFSGDVVEGTKVIQSPFSPTQMIQRLEAHPVVPAIGTVEAKTKPRVLYYGGMKPVRDMNGSSSSISFTSDTLNFNTTTYPYAGHYNDPYSPTLDLNFGQARFESYSTITALTNNTLFEAHWRNYIESIPEGKLVTSWFYLTEVDINFIKDNLNSKIFVKDSYYYINRIIDYSPLADTLTQVELLKISVGVPFQDSDIQVVDTTVVLTPIDITDFAGLSTQGNGGVVATGGLGSNNDINSTDVMVAGGTNFIDTDVSTTLVVGNDNEVQSGAANAFILGGSNNSIAGGVNNSGVIGNNNIQISRDNEFWIGDVHILNGLVLSQFNVVDGGENELRGPSASPINCADSGLDIVFDQFPTNGENIIDGGEI